MIGTRVRKLSDGEELVVEGSTPERLVDPRERAIEARRLALGDDYRSRAKSALTAGRPAAIDLDETPPLPRRAVEER